MRRLLALLGALLALGLVACGGQEIEADEVPGPPPDLPLPAGSEALGGDAQQEGGTATEPTATPEATATPTPEGGGASATPEPSAEEPTTAAAPESEATATPEGGGAAGPVGGETSEFEEFCRQNPGAC